jgi:hypothetical protein
MIMEHEEQISQSDFKQILKDDARSSVEVSNLQSLDPKFFQECGRPLTEEETRRLFNPIENETS